MRFSRYVGLPFRFPLRLASGDGEIRTLDPLLARQVLSQLSYTPTDAGRPVFTGYPLSSFFFGLWSFLDPMGLSVPFLFLPRVLDRMGLSGLEPPTSRLSGVRSNRLSYKPFSFIWQPPTLPCRLQHSTLGRLRLNLRVRYGNGCFPETYRHQNLFFLLFFFFLAFHSKTQQYTYPYFFFP